MATAPVSASISCGQCGLRIGAFGSLNALADLRAHQETATCYTRARAQEAQARGLWRVSALDARWQGVTESGVWITRATLLQDGGARVEWPRTAITAGSGGNSPAFGASDEPWAEPWAVLALWALQTRPESFSRESGRSIVEVLMADPEARAALSTWAALGVPAVDPEPRDAALAHAQSLQVSVRSFLVALQEGLMAALALDLMRAKP